MPEYLAPGVYVEETSFRAKSIEGVGTSTTAFVGPTRKGPYRVDNDTPESPELLTSYGDFERIYGGFSDLALGAGAPATNSSACLSCSFFDSRRSTWIVCMRFIVNLCCNFNESILDLVDCSSRFVECN